MIKRKHTANICVSLLSLLLILFFIEISARLFLHRLPLKFHEHLDWPLITLAQSSKQGVIPKDYILILGDSYAQGTGDWFHSIDKTKNDGFGSHHILHKKTRRDVLSFGKGNNSSIYAIAVYPSSWFSFFKSSLLYKLTPPKSILVYFYAGNDLDDNVDILDKYYDSYKQNANFRNPIQFNQFLDRLILKENKNWVDQFIVPGLFKRLVNSIQFRINRISQRANSHNLPQNKEGVLEEHNKIRVNGEIIAIPDDQGPDAMVLSPEDLENSFYAFDLSLNRLKKTFPRSQISIVYIPSVLESYTLATQILKIEYEGDEHLVSINDFNKRKSYIYSRIKEIAGGKRMRLVDLRPALLEASKSAVLHGPNDWTHFNQKGYRILADVILQEGVV